MASTEGESVAPGSMIEPGAVYKYMIGDDNDQIPCAAMLDTFSLVAVSSADVITVRVSRGDYGEEGRHLIRQAVASLIHEDMYGFRYAVDRVGDLAVEHHVRVSGVEFDHVLETMGARVGVAIAVVRMARELVEQEQRKMYPEPPI